MADGLRKEMFAEDRVTKRYELTALIGPCTEQEAKDMMLAVAWLTDQRLGAVWALEVYEDELPEPEVSP